MLTAEQAAFIESGLSINIGASDDAARPCVARGMAVRISEDGNSCSVWFALSQSGMVAEALRANGRIAVVFSQPSSHRTIQLKGKAVQLAPFASADGSRLLAQQDGFAADLAKIGFERPYVQAVLAAPPDDIAVATFRIVEAFVQTPGPGAGRPLHAQA